MKESQKKFPKLKNLLVVSSGFPDKLDKHYISLFVKKQVIALSKYFDNIYVFAPYPHNPKILAGISGLPPSRDFTSYKKNNIHVIFVKYFDAPGKAADSLRARRWLKMICSIVDSKKLKFDVIHGHFTYPGGKVAQLMSQKYGKPYFVSVHENQDWLKREVSAPLNKRTDEIWRGARKVFFVNKIEADKLHNRYKNIQWLPNGIDTKRFRPMDKIKARRKLHLSLNKKILLSVGSLIPIKNYRLLISSIAKLSKTQPDIYCVIIGNGKEKPSLLKLIRRLSLQDKVKIVSQLPNDQLQTWYNASDVYCVSSRRESFGVTQLEAMACGIPVAATPNGGSQMIVEKNCGIISKGHYPVQFAQAIEAALGKRWNNQNILNNANKYDEAIIAKQLANQYVQNR